MIGVMNLMRKSGIDGRGERTAGSTRHLVTSEGGVGGGGVRRGEGGDEADEHDRG